MSSSINRLILNPLWTLNLRTVRSMPSLSVLEELAQTRCSRACRSRSETSRYAGRRTSLLTRNFCTMRLRLWSADGRATQAANFRKGICTVSTSAAAPAITIDGEEHSEPRDHDESRTELVRMWSNYVTPTTFVWAPTHITIHVLYRLLDTSSSTRLPPPNNGQEHPFAAPRVGEIQVKSPPIRECPLKNVSAEI